MKIKKSICCRYVSFFAAAVISLTAAVNVHADYQSTVLNDNPIAYFALDLTIDNNGTATDLSGNGNSSVYYNIYPTTGPTAYIPNAAIFTGVSIQSYVDLSTATNAGILNFGGPITMEAWVQSTNTIQGPADIIGKGYDSSQNDNELVLRANSGGNYNYYGGTYNNTNNGASASGGQQTTNWTYLVATYDGTNWNLYVNGQLAGQGADTVGAINFSDPWAIGTGSADGASRFFQGNICQVALYTNALTPAQVLTHFYVGEINSSPDSSAPIITAQPQSQQSYVAGSVTFGVAAVSASPMTNQWFKDSSPLAGQTNSTLTLTNLQLGDAGSYSVVVGNANGTTNSVTVSLTVSVSASLQWSANANTGVWDTTNSANWLNLSNSQQTTFNPGDEVLFDDTAEAPTSVSVSGTVLPSMIIVNSSTNNFIFTGSGTISGSTSLIKEGSSLLTFNSAGNFTGPVTIEGGSIYAGDYSFSSVSSVIVTNNSTFDFAGGNLTGNKPVYVSGSGADGLGALVNSSYEIYGNVLDVTLTGDTTFGGSSRWDLASGSTVTGPYKITINRNNNTALYGEWDSVAMATNVGDIELLAGKLGIKGMGASLGDPNATLKIDASCELDLWNGTVHSDSGYNKNFYVSTNAIFKMLTSPNTYINGNIVVESNAFLQFVYGSGAQTLNGTITLRGPISLQAGNAPLIFSNVISGPGGIVSYIYGTGEALIFAASNTYSGPTVIGDGMTLMFTNNGALPESSPIFFGGSNPANDSLDVSSLPGQTFTLNNNQLLGGVGAVNGSLIIAPGAVLSPAGTNVLLGITNGMNAIGMIVVSNNITLNGTTIIKLDGSGTNDMVQAGTNIIYGGALNLVNISGSSLVVGDSFQIFSAMNYSGSFADITPAAPGEGLAWDLSQLSSGKISVAAAGSSGPVVNSTQIIGGNLVLTGTGGTANGTYYVLTSTNLVTSLADWVPVSTNTYDANGNFSVTNAFSTGVPQQFYIIKQ